MDQKLRVPTSIKFPVSKKHFEIDHITTQSFMSPRPICAIEVFPTRKLDLKVESFCRLDPLPVPTFGRARVANRAFFVPYRTVFKDFDSFITQTPVSLSKSIDQVPNVPLISNLRLVDIFVGNAAFVTAVSGSNPYDFIYKSGASSYQAYKLTPNGVNAMTVLNSLGYKINWRYDDDSSYSVLPIFCYVKVFLDWFFPSEYAVSNTIAKWQYVFEMFESWSDWTNHISVNDLRVILGLICTSYDASLVSKAWDKPIAPNNADAYYEPDYVIKDLTLDYPFADSVMINNNSPYTQDSFSPVINSTDGHEPYPLSQYMLDALRSLTDMTMRHRLSSVRTVDRYLATFGINLSSEIMKRSIYLGSDEFSLQFGDVMSHSSTQDAELGAYAGKGVGYGNGQFSCDLSNEFGLFLIINTVTPITKTYQGIDRLVLHKSSLDFMNFDFDHLATMPISQGEVYVPIDGTATSADPAKVHDAIYGWWPIYGDYFIDKGLLTGLHACNSQNSLLEAYNLFRDVSSHVSNDGSLEHSLNMATGSDRQQYLRIFDSVDYYDKINFIHHIEVTSTDNAAPLFETYEFDNSQKSVTMNIGGTTVN